MDDAKSIVIDSASLARVIYEAIKETDPDAFIDEFSLELPIAIDGNFQLHALATLFLIKWNDLNALYPVA